MSLSPEQQTERRRERCRRTGKANRKHGHAALNTPTYQSWAGMRRRCLNPTSPAFPRYGGRGITICARWALFENFLADMGDRPDGLSLERIDNNRGYEPGNCRWATPMEQANNRSDCRILCIDGESRTVAEWSRATGIGHSTILERLRRGWSPARAIGRSPC